LLKYLVHYFAGMVEHCEQSKHKELSLT
jgi:hypothetical protein